MDKWINFGKILSPLATLFSVATVLITVFGFFYKKVIKNKRKKKEVKQSVKVPMAEISPEVMEELDEDDEIIPPYQGDEEDEDVYDDPYITQKKVNKFYISLAILTTICLLTTISELIINLFVDYNVFNLVIFWIKIILSSISIILIIVITIMLILLLLKFYPKDDGETINIYLFYFYWFMIIGIIGSIILSVLIFVIDQNVLLKVNLGLISGLIALYFLLILIINHHLGSINKIFKFRGSILCLAVGLIFIVECAAIDNFSANLSYTKNALLEYENHYYQKNKDNTLSFVMTNYDDIVLEIPSSVNGKKVNSVVFKNDYEEGNKNYKEVIFPDSIEKIPFGTLSGCSNLEKLTLPRIDWQILYTYNTDNTFESNVTLGCIFGQQEYSNAYQMYTKNGGKAISGPREGEEVSGNYYYYLPNSLYSVTINSGIIPPHAFENCKKITEVNLNVSAIKQNAFDGCGALKEIDNVTYIDNWAYTNAGARRTTLKDDTIGLAEYALSSSSIDFITLNNGLKYIGSYALSYSHNTTIIIPESVERIDAYAFYKSRITSATFASCGNWKAGDNQLNSVELSIPETAANYLTTTYNSLEWTKN